MSNGENRVTKSYSIKLIKPVGVDEGNWEFAGQVLSDLDYVCYRVKNKAATKTYMNLMEKLEYEDIYGKNTFDKYYAKRYGIKPDSMIPKEASEDEEFVKYGLAKELIRGQATESNKVVKELLKEILKGNKSLPNFKRNQPSPIRSRMINISKEDGKYYTELSLLSREYADKSGRRGRKKCKIKFLLSSKGQEKVVLDRLINGEYKLCDSHLHRKIKNGRVDNYLIAAYSFIPVKIENLIPNKILGVDMGIAYPAYMAVSNSKVNGYINGGEIEQFRNGIEARRKSMRNQLKYQSDNRIGHGSKRKLKPLKKLEAKVSNFRDLTNHRYAKYIVDFALKNNCSVIQMEELKGISSQSAFLKRWSYSDLQEKIKKKAGEKGIIVNKVSPKYTSQRCNKCGYISKESRKTQDKFECVNCGHKDNADRNAARNLSVLNIDKEIKKQCKAQKISY